MRHIFLIGLITALIITVSNSDTFAQRMLRKAHYANNVRQKRITHAHYKHKKYTNLPKWGARVTKLNSKVKAIKYRNRNYYFHSGLYYRKINNQYTIVRAPIGIRVTILPSAAARIVVRTKPYYYYFGTFYVKQKDSTFETVNPPIGAKVEILPDGLEEIKYNGETVYKLEDTYFKPELTEEGQLVYKVIKAE